MVWAVGVDTTANLKDKLTTFIEGKIASAPYKARLPRRHFKVEEGGKAGKRTGTRVEVFAEADEQQPWVYADPTNAAKKIREDYHRIAFDVKGDTKSGGIDAGDALFSVLRSIFSDPDALEELIALGIYDVRQVAETTGFEAAEFHRPLFLTCNTDVYLN